MAQIWKSRASLRIFGESLDPDEVTGLLGSSPTTAQTKGDEIVGSKTGNIRIAPVGFWRLTAKKRTPEDLDGQIDEILSKLTDEPAVWSQLSNRFNMNMFVGLFMEKEMEGCVVSVESLRKLADRGIELQLDIYDGRG